MRLPEVLPGERMLGVEDAGWRPEIDYLPAVLTGPWPQVENTITLADDFRIVLHHHDGVLILLQMVQNLHETAAIARVQADARLIQDVQSVDQRRPQRRGQIDALHLAPRGCATGGRASGSPGPHRPCTATD